MTVIVERMKGEYTDYLFIGVCSEHLRWSAMESMECLSQMRYGFLTWLTLNLTVAQTELMKYDA